MPPTVADLIQRGVTIHWWCDLGCHGVLDLRRVAPDTVLANRRPPCPIDGCPGRVEFKRTNGPWQFSLDTWTERDPEWWAYHDARRAELIGLGFRVVMGKWVGPDTTKPAPDEPERA